MAKIRGFKPNLWTDEDFVELSPFARLLWLGMWNYACDNGHLADKSKQIKMRVLPTDDVNCADLLRELEARHLIERADGWITIPNLTWHQKPDRRYFLTCEKDGCDDLPETVSQRAARRANTGARGAHAFAHDEVKGSDVKGSDGDSSAAGTAPAKRATQLPKTWKPNDTHLSFAAENCIDANAEAEQFRDHHAAKGQAMKDWDAAFRTWLRNAVKWRKDQPAPKPTYVLPHVNDIEQPPNFLSPAEVTAWEAERRAAR